MHSTGLSSEPLVRPNREKFDNLLDCAPNQILTYKHTKERLLGHVLAPSYILSYFSKYFSIGYVTFSKIIK
jgi:hypothetical protein